MINFNRWARRFAVAALTSAAVAMLFTMAPARAQQPIKIGMSSALTGPYSEYGEGAKRGLMLAIDKWNKAGGINGRKIEIAELLDDQLVPDRAVQNVRRILDNKDIVAIIGPAGSGPMLAVVDMAQADGRPFINPVAQTPTIAYPNGVDKDPRPNIFTFGVQNNVEAEFFSAYLAKRYKRIGLLHESTSYGVTGADLLTKALKNVGGNIEVAAESFNQRTPDLTAQLVRVQRANVEAIVVICNGSDMANIRRTMVRLNVNLPLLSTAGGLSNAYVESAGDLVVGTRAPMVGSIAAANPPAATKAFLDAYKATYGADRFWGADPDRPQLQMALNIVPIYDAANVLFEAIKRANSTDSKAILAALEAIENYPGANATYSFSKSKHHAIAPTNMVMLEYRKVGDRFVLTPVTD